MRKLVLKLKLPRAIAKCVKEVISVETTEKLSRSSVTISESNGWVQLVIKSDDTSSLRAAANSYIRWIDIAITTCRYVNRRM